MEQQVKMLSRTIEEMTEGILGDAVTKADRKIDDILESAKKEVDSLKNIFQCFM